MSSRHVTNICLVVLSTLVAILAAEALARLMVEESRFRPLMAVEGVPMRTVDGVELWGDKDPRYDSEDVRRAAAEPRAFTIVGLGDSILYGVMLSNEQTYLEQMRQSLTGESDTPVEVLNLAVPGYNTLQESAAYKEIAQTVKPDLVLVHYWEDDAHQYRVVGGYVVDLGNISEEEGRLVVRSLPVPPAMNDFLLVHSRLYDLLTRAVVARGYKPQADDWTRVSKPLADIQERVESGGGRLVILASPRLDQEKPRSNADLPRLLQFASARGVEVVDLTEWLPGVTSKDIALDGCHFNEKGHRLLGQHLAEYLRPHALKDSLD